MGISIRNNIDKLIIAFAILILFSSDKNLLITHYLIGKKNISLMTISFIACLSLFLLFLISTRGSLILRRNHINILISSLFLALYFGVHEIIFGDSLVSIKYSIYLLLLISILFIRHNIFYVFKFLGYTGGIISLCIVLQQLLMITFQSGYLNNYEVAIDGDEWGRWPSCDYVLPYGLGLIERCDYGYYVEILGIQINRSLFFMTEPKYVSSILLVTFSSLIVSKSSSSYRSLFLILHVIAIFFAASATAILVIVVSVFLVYLKFIGPKIYTLTIFLFPLFVMPTLIYTLSLIVGVDGFVLARILSASNSIGSGGFENLSILGQAFGECEKLICEDKGLLDNLLLTYGISGMILFWGFLYYLAKPMFEIIRSNNIDNSDVFALMILLNTYAVFNIYFFGDILNLFGMLILLIIIFLPEYISNKKAMLLSR